MISKEDWAIWKPALLEPTQKQVAGALELLDEMGNTIGRCCLGVACAAFGIPKTRSGSLMMYGNDVHYLPHELANRFKISDSGQFKPGEVFEYQGVEHHSLVSMNDRGVPFAVIADAIERFFVEKE